MNPENIWRLVGVLLVVGLMLLVVLYQATHRGFLPDNLGLIARLLVVPLVFAIYRFRQKGKQAVRDEEMLLLEKEIEIGKDRLFYFYLRPFAITSQIRVRNPKYRKWDVVNRMMNADGSMDLEEIIQRALEATGINFLALGKPGEAVGAGRISVSEEQWKEKFEKFARTASGILVMPSTNPGTLWEMKRLVEEGYLNKVVFVQASKMNVREWIEIKRTVASFGLILADHDPNGQIFKILSSGTIESSPIPGLTAPSEEGMSIQRLMHR